MSPKSKVPESEDKISEIPDCPADEWFALPNLQFHGWKNAGKCKLMVLYVVFYIVMYGYLHVPILCFAMMPYFNIFNLWRSSFVALFTFPIICWSVFSSFSFTHHFYITVYMIISIRVKYLVTTDVAQFEIEYIKRRNSKDLEIRYFKINYWNIGTYLII